MQLSPLSLSSIPLSVGCPDPSMLSNIFQETGPDTLMDISFSTAGHHQPTPPPPYLTAAAVTSVFSAVSSAYKAQAVVASHAFVEGELTAAVQDISCLANTEELEIPLFTVPSLEDMR